MRHEVKVLKIVQELGENQNKEVCKNRVCIGVYAEWLLNILWELITGHHSMLPMCASIFL